MAKPDKAGRAIAGLLGYTPTPGLYSRLERAVEAMPETVRVEELPGLIKRHKEGVPGWELKEVDLPGLVGDQPTVSRQALLDRVRQRSPVYTHHEKILGGNGPHFVNPVHPQVRDPEVAEWTERIGQGNAQSGYDQFSNWGQGGQDYTELLLLQPDAPPRKFDNHWSDPHAVAHARFDTHGDALRINELQSDLGIHNRKAREARNPPPQLPSEADEDYNERLAGLGFDVEPDFWGNPRVFGPSPQPFPLEDAWADILIKRMAIEAAHKGHRAIEVASPVSVFAKTGNPGDEAASMARMEHFYGRVVPGALERLGKKMGGLTDESASLPSPISYVPERPAGAGRQEIRDTIRAIQGDDYAGAPFWRHYNDLVLSHLPAAERGVVYDEFGGYGWSNRTPSEIANDMYDHFIKLGYEPTEAQAVTSRALFEAQRAAGVQSHYATQKELASLGSLVGETSPPAAGKRYVMSDAMRRRIIEGGIGAAVAAPVMTDDDLIERLGK